MTHQQQLRVRDPAAWLEVEPTMGAIQGRNGWHTAWLWWNLLLTIGVGIIVAWLGFTLRAVGFVERDTGSLDALDFLSSPADFFLAIMLVPPCIAAWLIGSSVAAAASAAGLRHIVALRALLVVVLASIAWLAANSLDFGLYHYTAIAIGLGLVARRPGAVPWGLSWVWWNLLLSVMATIVIAVLWLILVAFYGDSSLVAEGLELTSFLWGGVWILGCGLIAVLWCAGLRRTIVLRGALVAFPLLILLAGTRSPWHAALFASVQSGFALVARLPMNRSDDMNADAPPSVVCGRGPP